MDSLRTYRVGIAAAIVLLLLCGWMLVQPQAKSGPPYLSSSTAPDGMKGLILLLEEKGHQVKEWRQPMRALPATGGQALMMVEPWGLTEREQSELLDWVQRGNELLLFEQEPGEWGDLPFETKLAGEKEGHESRIVGPLLGQELTGTAQTQWRLDDAPDQEALILDDLGVLAARTAYGEGNVSLFLVSDWLTNEGVLQKGHFEAVWPYVQGKESVLWVDEYHHGLQDRPSWLAVYPGWLIAGCLQLALVLLLWIWWRGKRFGPVYTLREWTVRRGDETLLAVSSWYEHKNLARDALLHREAFLRQRLYDRWGVHRRAEYGEILSLARTKWSEADVGRLRSVLEALEKAKTDRRYTSKRLLQDSLLIDDVIQRLEKE